MFILVFETLARSVLVGFVLLSSSNLSPLCQLLKKLGIWGLGPKNQMCVRYNNIKK